MKYKNEIIKAIEYHYPNAHIYLFGSWATGKNKLTSDIDIAIDVGHPIDLYEYSRMLRTLDNLDIVNRIDLIDLQRADTNFKNVIRKEMIVWKD